MDRPDPLFYNGLYAGLNDFCYAEFLRHRLVSMSK